ncbi:hypothetical protein TNCV_2320371 [Trichonephila clavipes]|nr:hypothetical protein TNCV_2320371 [Trichonephila clavipes]
MREKGGNRLVPSPNYMVDAIKLSNQPPRVSGESLRCVERGVILMEQNTSSVGKFWPFLSHQILSRTFLDVTPGLTTV